MSCAFVAGVTSYDLEASAFCDSILWSVENKLISCAPGWVSVAGGIGYCVLRVVWPCVG
ncbi:MAG: hypothetical protein EZS28_056534, partial [Streblomastix strix]